MWWQRQKPIVWHTTLSTEECLRRMSEDTDIGVRTIFSFSGYKGKKKVLSAFEGNQFRLWKRRYYRNDFAPILFGSLMRIDSGSLIEARFDVRRFTKVFMMIWLAFAALIGLPLISQPLMRGLTRDAQFSILVIGIMLAFGYLLPEFGRLIGKGEETYLRKFVESTLAAQRADFGTPMTASPIENKPLG